MNERTVVNEIHIFCRIVNIRGDDACIFSSASHLVHGNVSMADIFQTDILCHVFNDCESFKPFIQQHSWSSFNIKDRYLKEMSKSHSFGTICEIKAAGWMYTHEFQIFMVASFLEYLERQFVQSNESDSQGILMKDILAFL